MEMSDPLGMLTDEHIFRWRASKSYREFKMSNARPQLCKLEQAAFESWAASHGGLQGSRGRTPWAHLFHMHMKWRGSSEFQAWMPEHKSKHMHRCRGRDIAGEFLGCGFGYSRMEALGALRGDFEDEAAVAALEAARADFVADPANGMCCLVCLRAFRPGVASLYTDL